jgi:hypothetical protein
MKMLPLNLRSCLLAALLAPASAFAAGVPAPANADALASEAAPGSGNTLWSARSGGYRPLSSFGLDSHLSDENPGATLVFQPDGSLSLFSSVIGTHANDRGSASVPWCAEASGLLRIGSLGQECLMQGMLQFELPGQIASAQTGVNFSGQNWDVTLSYGLSWLMSKLDLSSDPAVARPGLASSGLFPDSINLVDAQVQGLAMGAQWRLTQASALQLNAALNQLRIQNGAMLPGINLNEAQAGVGLVYGPFSGNVSGHMQRARGPALPGNGALWGGLDLGVSWRTPWRGELTLGARNLVTKGEEELLPDPQAASIDRSSTRTPYVRYKQDL